jgi:hypothetical protein
MAVATPGSDMADIAAVSSGRDMAEEYTEPTSGTVRSVVQSLRFRNPKPPNLANVTCNQASARHARFDKSRIFRLRELRLFPVSTPETN